MMKLKFAKFVALLFLVIIGVVSIQAQVDETSKLVSQLDNGSIKGNVYENKLLGLRIKFPSSMQVDPTAEVAADVKGGVEMLREGKSVDEKRLREMLEKERMVFAISIPPTEESVGASLSLTIKKDETREELRPMVDRTIKFFTDSGKFKLAKTSSEQILGSLNLVSFGISTEVNGTRIFSTCFVTRRNGYLLTFAIGHIDERELSKMEAVLKKIELF